MEVKRAAKICCMDEKRLSGYSGVGGGELSADDGLIHLRCLWLGFEALDLLGLLGVVVAGLFFSAEEITNELPGTFVEVAEGAALIGMARSA